MSTAPSVRYRSTVTGHGAGPSTRSETVNESASRSAVRTGRGTPQFCRGGTVRLASSSGVRYSVEPGTAYTAREASAIVVSTPGSPHRSRSIASAPVSLIGSLPSTTTSTPGANSGAGPRPTAQCTKSQAAERTGYRAMQKTSEGTAVRIVTVSPSRNRAPVGGLLPTTMPTGSQARVRRWSTRSPRSDRRREAAAAVVAEQRGDLVVVEDRVRSLRTDHRCRRQHDRHEGGRRDSGPAGVPDRPDDRVARRWRHRAPGQHHQLACRRRVGRSQNLPRRCLPGPHGLHLELERLGRLVRGQVGMEREHRHRPLGRAHRRKSAADAEAGVIADG